MSPNALHKNEILSISDINPNSDSDEPLNDTGEENNDSYISSEQLLQVLSNYGIL
jgi:hypothetical protein